MKDIDIDGIDLAIILGLLYIMIIFMGGFASYVITDSQKEQTKRYELQLQIEKEKSLNKANEEAE